MEGVVGASFYGAATSSVIDLQRLYRTNALWSGISADLRRITAKRAKTAPMGRTTTYRAWKIQHIWYK